MTSGIAVDNHKLEKFKEVLESNGFDDFEIVPLEKDSKIIKVTHDVNRFFELKKICKELELHFKRRN